MAIATHAKYHSTNSVSVTYYFNSNESVVAIGGINGCNYRASSDFDYNQDFCVVEATGLGTCERAGGIGSDCPSAEDVSQLIAKNGPVENSYCTAGGSFSCGTCNVPFNQVDTIRFNGQDVSVTYYFNNDSSVDVIGGFDGCNYRATGGYFYDRTTCVVKRVSSDFDACYQIGGLGFDCPSADDACSNLLESLSANDNICKAGGISTSSSSCQVPFHVDYSINYNGTPINVTAYFNADGTSDSVGGADGCQYKCTSDYIYDQTNCFIDLTGTWVAQLTSGNATTCEEPKDACNLIATSGLIEKSYCTAGGNRSPTPPPSPPSSDAHRCSALVSFVVLALL